MDEKPTSRRSVFLFWHWPKWLWATIGFLAILMYPFSHPFAYQAWMRTGANNSVRQVMAVIYFPTRLLARKSPAVARLYQGINDQFEAIAGPAPAKIIYYQETTEEALKQVIHPPLLDDPENLDIESSQ